MAGWWPRALRAPCSTIPKARARMPEIIRRPSPGHINLRGSLADAAFGAAVSSVLGIELPQVANTVAQGSAVAAYWLGPDEWLVATSRDREAALAARLREALAGIF